MGPGIWKSKKHEEEDKQECGVLKAKFIFLKFYFTKVHLILDIKDLNISEFVNKFSSVSKYLLNSNNGFSTVPDPGLK